jgi:hypothetical protein
VKPHPKSTYQDVDGHTRHPQAISSSYSYYGRKAADRVRPERPESVFQGIERVCVPESGIQEAKRVPRNRSTRAYLHTPKRRHDLRSASPAAHEVVRQQQSATGFR